MRGQNQKLTGLTIAYQASVMSRERIHDIATTGIRTRRDRICSAAHLSSVGEAG
jgi:hypothetical protein